MFFNCLIDILDVIFDLFINVYVKSNEKFIF